MTALKNLTLLALCLSVAAPVFAADEMPQDVHAYINRRTGCNYWPSEHADSKLRKAEIARHIRALNCATLDHDEAKLNARYQGKPDIVAAIADAHDAMPD